MQGKIQTSTNSGRIGLDETSNNCVVRKCNQRLCETQQATPFRVFVAGFVRIRTSHDWRVPRKTSSLISQNVTSKSGRGGRTKHPWAFTEHGVAMLLSVLRSPTAARVNIEIMRDVRATSRSQLSGVEFSSFRRSHRRYRTVIEGWKTRHLGAVGSFQPSRLKFPQPPQATLDT